MKISTRFSLRRKFSLIILLSFLCFALNGQTNIGGVINDYESVTNITNPGCGTCDTNPACINDIEVADASAFSVGDKVLIVQLKGATIDQTNTATGGDIISLGNAGNYEFFDIGNIVGNIISPSAPLKNTYDAIGLIQLVRVPNYAGDVNVISELQATPWDPATGEGGIIALFVEGTLTLNANVNASGAGYIGAEMTANGSPDNCSINPNVQYNLGVANTDSWFKGGGVANSGANNQKGRSPLGNGGGAGVSGDSGGGGGANFGAGGIGGDRWCDVNGATAGGIGGNALAPFITNQNRVFFGGAGGAGFVTSNNSAIASNGGGIVVIRATTLVGNNNTIDVSGIDATATATGIDGGGGGGAGGSVAFDISAYSGNLNIDVQSLNTGVLHGPGGGGGGGVLLHNLAALPAGINVLLSGGNPGAHNNAPNIGNTHNAQAGGNGGIITYYNLVETIDTDSGSIINDGIPDLCDLDSDNDGILDSVEDGGTGIDPSLDADGDGIPNYLDQSDAGAPAFVDSNGDGVNDVYDTDGDGTPDFQDLDSDNDGCFDVLESGGTDTNDDGALDGDGFNTFGQITSGGTITDGYDGANSNETIATQVNYGAPTNQTENAGDTATFAVSTATITSTGVYSGASPNTLPDFSDPSATTVATGFNYQWYLGDPNAGGVALSNDSTYSGVTTASLDILTNLALDGNQYCVVITNINNSCENIECAILNVSIPPCGITGISSSNESVCSDNGTSSNPSDDTFTADITVTFVSAPATGTLDLSGDGTASVSVVGLTSPHTFTGVTLPADGGAIDLTATFSDDLTCTLNDTNVTTAPVSCSADCVSIIPPGSPTGPIAGTDITLSITGIGGSAGAILNSITVAGEPNPFTELYPPSLVNYNFVNPAATSQFIRDQNVLGANITDGPAVFDAAVLEANRDRDLAHYLALDNTITNSDFVEYYYNTPITAASNRYIVITERNGNNRLTIQAIDSGGNLVGSPQLVNTPDYFDTGVLADNVSGQNVFMAVYPLTTFFTAGTDVEGIRLSYISSGGDGGDGKAFIIYDPASLVPPPSILTTTSAIQPTCPSNTGSITIDAQDNGGGTIEYSINGAAGPWQLSPTFTGLGPATYTPAVRYQSTPACLEVSINPITLDDACCNLLSITASNISACTDNGTPSNINDDTFTADITVTFNVSPGSGTLDLTGDGTASVSAVGLTSPHTFVGVVLPANGLAISLTATFSDEAICPFDNTNVFTAPFECSDDACSDTIPLGNPTAALLSADVSFNINSGINEGDPAILNSITIAGQPNPFSGYYAPNNVNYQYANPLATSQFIRDQTAVVATVADGPAIYDPALLAANAENDLRHYLSMDDTIDVTDFNEFIYNSPITAASNRYVVITERNGNNELSIQALDNTLSLTGNVVLANPGNYIDTGVETDFNQNVFVTIYPLTALVPSGTDIQGIRVTQTGAAALGGDGGDGKVFIIYDPAFLTPPPTIDVTTSAVQPDCLTNLGSITIDATDNGGGALEYSINGLAGPFQASPTFTGLTPGSYTPAVRYVATPTCSEVAVSPIVLDAASCSISLIKSVTSVTSAY